MTTTHATGCPCFEPLESRLLLDGSVTVEIDDGHLYIVGDAADNAVVLTGLENGGYEITGLETAGGMTTINGGWHVVISEPIVGRVEVDLGGGDDTLNIGHLKGLDTTIADLVLVRMGHGTNQLNVGRIDRGGTLSFAGQVTMNGTLEMTNTTFGTGNVLITGARMGGFNAHLGYGEGEREVIIADLWYGMVYSPPSLIHEIDTVMGGLTITNPYGQLNATIHDTSATNVTFSTAGQDDVLDFAGVNFLDTVISTYGGEDVISFEASEYRGNRINGLTLNTGLAKDTVFMSDTQVSFYTDFDMGDNRSGLAQELYISAYGGCEFSAVTIRGRHLSVGFNTIGGTNETLIHSGLDMQTTHGRVDDTLTMIDVRLFGDSTVNLSGGNDSVLIYRSALHLGTMMFDLSAGDDTFLVGQNYSDPLPGDTTRLGTNTIVHMGDGADQVAITNASTTEMLFVDMGASTGRGQRVRIATVGGTVHVGALGIAGTGKTNVYIGNTESDEPSVLIDDILSISTGMDMSRDIVAIQNVQVLGETAMSTGAGTDVLAIQRSEFSGPVTAHMGNGVDIMSIWNCDFNADAQFHGDEAPDLFWILDNRFAARAIFDGGHGRDHLNRTLSLRNTFSAPGQPEVVSIENPIV